MTAGPDQPRPPMSVQRLQLAERLYREGILPSGEPLRGVRAGTEVSGALAACELCHRRSGMGSVEGKRVVPPITGHFLYEPRAQTPADLDARHTRGPDLAHAFGRDRTRENYTTETLMAAIRAGVVPGGGSLDELMPRYALTDADARLLVEYLGQLSDRWSPGVSEDTIHFGTVVTPGVDPDRRRAMLDVLQAFFDAKNVAVHREKQRDQAYTQSVAKTYRRWRLHVWDLTGAPETWDAQMAALYRQQPVFALISGVAEGTWAPVQRFCERQGLPCWFPTVDLPVIAEGDSYTTYFFGGVILEAEVLARRLLEQGRTRRRRDRFEELTKQGRALLRRFTRALSGSGIRVEEKVLRQIAPDTLRAALADVGSSESEAVVFWLRAGDVAQFVGVPVPGVPTRLLRGPGRRESTRLFPRLGRARRASIYRFELPNKRRANTAPFYAWLERRN